MKLKLLLCSNILLAVGGIAQAQTSFYTNQATQAVSIIGSPQPVQGPIPFAGVRVCNLPLTQSQPCLPLATITDSSGNTLSNSIGSNFGQFSADSFGRFTFGCTTGANLRLQWSGASNTPQGDIPITCPGSGLQLGGNNIFTGNNTFGPGSLTVNGTQTNTGALNLTGSSAGLLGCRVEGIRYVDSANLCGWSGTDIKGWIASAFADLPSSSGTVFVTNGTYTETTGSINAGVSPCVNPPSTGNGQTLILDTGVLLTINHSITVLCGGTLDRPAGNAFGGWIIAGGSFPPSTPMIDVGDTVNGAINATVRYQRLNGNSVTGIIGIRERQINDSSSTEGNIIQNHMGGGIIIDGTSGVTGDFLITKNFIAASASASSTVCISLTNVQMPHILRNSCVSASAGLQTAGLYVTGAGNTGVGIQNLYCEKQTDCVKADNSGGIWMQSITGANSTTNTVHITNTFTGTAIGWGLQNNGGSNSFPVVLNDRSTTNISSANPPAPNGQIPFYSFSGGGAFTEWWQDITGLTYNPSSSTKKFTSFGNLQTNSLLLSGTIQNTAQTATAGLTLKTGSGSANYTGTNTALAAVDTTNLCTTITVPTGWKLSVVASGVGQQNTAAAGISIALADVGATCTSGGITALNGSQRDFVPPAIATNDQPFATQYVLTGDGAAHSIALMAKTANAADAWVVLNGSTVSAPSMIYTLMPSN